MGRTLKLCFIVLLLICGHQLWAQSPSPVAQKLADQLFSKHQPDLLAVSVTLVPPGGTDLVIVAATDHSEIGHQSVCADLHAFDEFPFWLKGGAGMTIKGKVIGSTILAPLHDQKGNTIGAVNMRFASGDASVAAKLGRTIERELAGEIPSKSALFAPAQ
jgi:hypothetical protein